MERFRLLAREPKPAFFLGGTADLEEHNVPNRSQERERIRRCVPEKHYEQKCIASITRNHFQKKISSGRKINLKIRKQNKKLQTIGFVVDYLVFAEGKSESHIF